MLGVNISSKHVEKNTELLMFSVFPVAVLVEESPPQESEGESNTQLALFSLMFSIHFSCFGFCSVELSCFFFGGVCYVW